MLVGKLNLTRSLITLAVAITTFPIAVYLHNRGAISVKVLTWWIIFIIATIALVGYKEYKNKTLGGLFTAGNKHIGTLDATRILKETLEYEMGEKIRTILPISHPYLHPEMGDQVVDLFIKPNYGAWWVQRVPLERGIEAIKQIDAPMMFDRTARFKKKDLDGFARKSRFDIVEKSLRAVPIEDRSALLKQSLTQTSSNGNEGESEEKKKEDKKE